MGRVEYLHIINIEKGADGVTTIFGYDHIARGYEDLAGMLFMLGAQAALRE